MANKHILGTLLDATGVTPIANATIRFISTGTRSVVNSITTDYTTDSSGVYNFTVLFGVYTIQIRRQDELQFRTVCANAYVLDNGASTLEALIRAQSHIQEVNEGLIADMLDILAKTNTAASNASTSATNAATSATTATNKANESATSASSANTSATNAATSATTASAKTSEAVASATSASTSATNAATSAATATTKATAANTSATNAATSASTANTKASEAAASATTAGTKASEAAASASNAATSATNAAASATTAGTKANEAATSATNAATSATTATNKASESASSATAANTSATNAAASATSASTSATTATTKASNAVTSASNAAASATTAGTQASEAATSATNAAASATTASAKASEAATSATNAAASATSAAASATTATTKANNAEASATSASTSESNAAASASTATTKADEASISATTAVTKAGEAVISANSAAANATNAATSASDAAISATSAATSASTASTKANEAATSEINANTSAATATTKAGDAATSATNAAASATTAVNAVKSIGTSVTDAAASATSAANSANFATQEAVRAEVAADRAEAAVTVSTGALVDAGPVSLASGTFPPPLNNANLEPVPCLWSVAVGGVVGSITFYPGDALLYSTEASTYVKINNTTIKELRNISCSGDATWQVSFDGSEDVSATITLTDVGIGGEYTKVTVDSKGRVTSGSNPTTLAGYGITDAAPSSHVGSTGAAHGVVTTTVNGFMSASDKTKLDGIATGANKYVHPVSGVAAGTYKSVTVDANGHITAGTDPTTLAGYGITDAAPSSHIGSGGAAHANSTTTVAGFMSGADKTKLDGIATNANNYVHPTTDGSLHVPATNTTNNGKVLKAGATAGSIAWGTLIATDVGAAPSTHVGATGTAHGVATTSINGFMSSGDKTKLDGVATGATKNSTDAYLLARNNHTGTQSISTVAGLATELSTINANLTGKLDKAGGVISGPITENLPTATYTYTGDNITSIIENYLGGVKTISFQYTGNNITSMIEQYAGSTTTTTYVYDASGNLVSTSSTYA